jgi:type I restriction enzyme S subunit
VPSGWKITRLDAVAEVLFSNVDKHTIDGEIPVRLCNYVDVYKNDRITGGIDFMEASAEDREIKKFQIRCGDVLATKDSEEADDIAISSLVAEDLPGVLCGYHLAMIRPRFTSISGSFIAWLHTSKSFRAQYEAKALGVTRFGLSQYAFRAARIPLPLLPEQQRIAAYLDASCVAIDAAVAAKRRQLETIDALRKSIIQDAVTKGLKPGAMLKDSGDDGLGDIPSHWRKDRMKDVVELRNEKTEEPSEETDYLELEDIESGTGCILNRRNTLEVESAVTLFKKGDVLFGKLRPYLEKYIHADFNGKCTGEILAFKPIRITSRFLFYCIASPWFIGRCNALAYGAKMPRVNWETQLASFNLPLPPAEEQETICSFLDAKLGELKSIVESIEAQITTLTDYRKSLIHECVIGKRRIAEADLNHVKAHG